MPSPFFPQPNEGFLWLNWSWWTRYRLGPPNGQAHLGRWSGNVTITYAVETTPCFVSRVSCDFFLPYSFKETWIQHLGIIVPWRNPHRWSGWWRPTSWDAQIKMIQSTRSNNNYIKNGMRLSFKNWYCNWSISVGVVDFGKTIWFRRRQCLPASLSTKRSAWLEAQMSSFQLCVIALCWLMAFQTASNGKSLVS